MSPCLIFLVMNLPVASHRVSKRKIGRRRPTPTVADNANRDAGLRPTFRVFVRYELQTGQEQKTSTKDRVAKAARNAATI